MPHLSGGEGAGSSMSSSVTTLNQPSKATKKLLRRFTTLPTNEVVLNCK